MRITIWQTLPRIPPREKILVVIQWMQDRDKSQRKKFESHSKECIYLGPESDHGAHILYDNNTKRIIHSRDVKFLENKLVQRKDNTAVRPLPLDAQLERKLAWKAIARAFDHAPQR